MSASPEKYPMDVVPSIQPWSSPTPVSLLFAAEALQSVVQRVHAQQGLQHLEWWHLVDEILLEVELRVRVMELVHAALWGHFQQVAQKLREVHLQVVLLCQRF